MKNKNVSDIANIWFVILPSVLVFALFAVYLSMRIDRIETVLNITNQNTPLVIKG